MRLVSLTFVLLLLQTLSYSQIPGSGTTKPSSEPIDTLAINSYNRLMKHAYDLIDGRDYIYYYSAIKSNPLYKSAVTAEGTIYTRGGTYPKRPVLYDIYKDILILNQMTLAGTTRLISLNKHAVDSFLITINNESTMFHMLYFADSLKMENGYYEILSKGKTEFLTRHRMDYICKDGHDQYIYTPIRYLFFNGTYNKITTRSKFLKLFGAEKAAMKKFIDSLHVNIFRDVTNNQMISILNYYETL